MGSVLNYNWCLIFHGIPGRNFTQNLEAKKNLNPKSLRRHGRSTWTQDLLWHLLAPEGFGMKIVKSW